MTNKEMIEEMEGFIFEWDKDGWYHETIIVDGEKVFNEPGYSHGFVHFQSLDTDEKICFCGIDWAYNHLFLPCEENDFAWEPKGWTEVTLTKGEWLGVQND